MRIRTSCVRLSLLVWVLCAPALALPAPQTDPGDLLGATPGASAERDATTPPPLAPPDEGGTLPLVPAGFIDEVVASGLNQIIGFRFTHEGTAILWKKQGELFVLEPGETVAEPYFDLSEEVAAWGSHGLLGLALDPDFEENGYLYLFYAVDHHHLTTFGTPAYDPSVSSDFVDTIGRVTRYTVDQSGGFTHLGAIDPSSRQILLGETIDTGIPLCSTGHSGGDLVFGRDRSLLVSVGDGANDAGASNTCVTDGIIRPEEDVEFFRAQMVDSLSGKILRLDAATGDGLPSNPFWDPTAPRSARSRVWALGLRNPFRFDIVTATGVPDPAAGLPGGLLIGDVGEKEFEELNVARAGGANFGWPIYEGHEPHATIAPLLTPNMDAPNPLFGHSIKGVGQCTQPFFHFQDLLVQETQGPPTWPNPCAAGDSISAAPVFEHTRAVIAWDHDLTAHIPVFDNLGVADSVTIDDPLSPTEGEPFRGSASIGGTVYTGDAFPNTYKNTYFQGDYGQGWIRNFVFDPQLRLREVREFAEPAGRVVHLDENGFDGALYYLDLTETGAADLRRIRYVPGNLPPDAAIQNSQPWGDAPLQVQFDATSSTDPEGAPLTYTWDFGPGTTASTAPRPVRTFPSQDVTGAATTILAKVFTMDPPQSMGTGNQDPEVMRDGVFPLPGTLGFDEMFDTAHYDVTTGQSDKDGEDWVGYSFPGEYTFTGVVFQEGRLFANVGGWFDSFTVQVRRAGEWVDATGVVSSPPYATDTPPGFETFDLSFDPLLGDGIRLHGEPGGVLEFLTIGELRVMATATRPDTTPTNHLVTLSVSDDVGATDQATLTVSAGNSPPEVMILAPPQFALYSTTTAQTFTLSGVASDAEHTAEELSCVWQVILHHDDHNHPGPFMNGCELDATVSTDGCPDVHYQELRYVVTDPLGLSSERSRYLIPECDQDLSGLADALEIAADPGLDLDRDGVPDSAQTDCNANALADLYEIFFGFADDLDGDGVPDECTPQLEGEGQLSGPAPDPGSPPPTSGTPPQQAPPGTGPSLPRDG